MSLIEKHLPEELLEDLARSQKAITEIIIEEIPNLKAAGMDVDELRDAIKELWIGGLTEWACRLPERLPADFTDEQRELLSRLAMERLPTFTRQINLLVAASFAELKKGGVS